MVNFHEFLESLLSFQEDGGGRTERRSTIVNLDGTSYLLLHKNRRSKARLEAFYGLVDACP